MTNLEAIKQVKQITADYQKSISDAEAFVVGAENEEMALAGIVKYMQNLGKSDPKKMAEVKELVAELDGLV